MELNKKKKRLVKLAARAFYDDITTKGDNQPKTGRSDNRGIAVVVLDALTRFVLLSKSSKARFSIFFLFLVVVELRLLIFCFYWICRRQWVREEDLAKDLKLHSKQLRRTLRFFEEEKLVTRDHRREVSVDFTLSTSRIWLSIQYISCM